MNKNFIGAVCALAMSLPASAAMNNLQDLLDGTTIMSGNWTVSGWTQVNNLATGNKSVVTPSIITVTDTVLPDGSLELEFLWNGEISLVGIGKGDYDFNYTVELTGDQIASNSFTSEFDSLGGDTGQGRVQAKGDLLNGMATIGSFDTFRITTLGEEDEQTMDTVDFSSAGSSTLIINFITNIRLKDGTPNPPQTLELIQTIHTISPANPVPVPAAVWFMASGLLRGVRNFAPP